MIADFTDFRGFQYRSFSNNSHNSRREIYVVPVVSSWFNSRIFLFLQLCENPHPVFLFRKLLTRCPPLQLKVE